MRHGLARLVVCCGPRAPCPALLPGVQPGGIEALQESSFQHIEGGEDVTE